MLLTVTTTYGQASQTITFDPLPAKVFGDAPIILSAFSTSGLEIAYESESPEVATIIDNILFIKSPGAVLITASQSGDGSFLSATPVSHTLNVDFAPSLIKSVYPAQNGNFDPTQSFQINFNEPVAKVLLGNIYLRDGSNEVLATITNADVSNYLFINDTTLNFNFNFNYTFQGSYSIVTDENFVRSNVQLAIQPSDQIFSIVVDALYNPSYFSAIGQVFYAEPVDGCSAITNSIPGGIALVDRGICPFVNKTASAEAAGASGVIIANNISNFNGMSGALGASIPTLGISYFDGTTLKSAIGSAPQYGHLSTKQEQAISGNSWMFSIEYGYGGSTYTYDFIPREGTFTALEGGTVVSELQTDDGMSSGIPIGFSFPYFGSNFSELRASANGFLTFNSQDIFATYFEGNQMEEFRTNIIAPLWDDLGGANGTSSYATTGTGSDRVFTFEWLNMSWDYGAEVGISFQVKLYESSGDIEFIYKQEAGSLSNANASIGLKGNYTTDFYSLADASSIPELSIAGFNAIAGKPNTGQVYTFTPADISEPTIQSTNISVLSGLTDEKMDLSWTKGNGEFSAVFMKQTDSEIDLYSANNSTRYPSSSVFGTWDVGEGWSCIYWGRDDHVIVTGLEAGLPYEVQVFEFNGLLSFPIFMPMLEPVRGNPVNITTNVTPPISPFYEFSALFGTFNPLVGGVPVVDIQADDAVSAAIPIGFEFLFPYSKGSFTELSATSNGFLNLNIGWGSYNENQLNRNSGDSFIAPLWDNLNGDLGTASYLTSGETPSRVFTFEWLNWKWDNTADEGISFQAKLHENSGKIEFVYRQEAGALVAPSASIGLLVKYQHFYSLDNATATPSLDPAGFDGIDAKPANGQTYTFDLIKNGNEVNFPALNDRTYGEESYKLMAESASGLTVLFTSSNPEVATINGSYVTIVGAGVATITASQSGDFNYGAAETIEQTLTVLRADQAINFPNQQDRLFGESDFVLNAVGGDSESPVTYTSSNLLIATIDGNTVHLAGQPGEVTITAAQLGDANYNSAISVEQTFCVNPEKPIITLDISNPFSPTLSAASFMAKSYQWYRNNVLIDGETSAILSPDTNGSFTVVAFSDGACMSFTSDPTELVITGTSDDLISAQLFPNPVKENVEINGVQRNDKLSVLSLNGSEQSVSSKWDGIRNVMVMSMSNLHKGIYLLMIQGTSGTKVIKFIKE